MHIIKLNAIDSTNTYLREISSKKVIDDYTIVTAKNQTNGRGQIGSVWESQNAKNLTVSVFKDVSSFNIEHPFFISMITSLAIRKALQKFSIPKLKIKWPNDILSEDKKICGILIENVIKKHKITASIIGVGLNVNQTQFKNLPKASSLHLITGKIFSLDEIMYALVENLKYYFNILQSDDYRSIKKEYEKYLFRKNKPSTFKDAEGQMFSGFIKSVSESGNLQVLLEDAVIKEFDLKEITLMY